MRKRHHPSIPRFIFDASNNQLLGLDHIVRIWPLSASQTNVLMTDGATIVVDRPPQQVLDFLLERKIALEP
jgi:hypothetical protein